MKAILDCYLHLCEHINANIKDGSDPLFKFIDIWNEQTEYKGEDGEDVEYPFDLPALFIDFDIPTAEPVGIFMDDLNVIITFYTAFETYADTHYGSTNINQAVEDLESMVKIHELLQGYTHEKTGSLTR